MRLRLFPDPASLPKAQALLVNAPHVSIGRSAPREIPRISNKVWLAEHTIDILGRRQALGGAAPIRDLRNGLLLSTMLWVAILSVCFG